VNGTITRLSLPDHNAYPIARMQFPERFTCRLTDRIHSLSKTAHCVEHKQQI
jgi:hypothetical protein